MKLLPFLSACLVLTAVFNLGLDLRQRAQIQGVAAQVARITAPGKADDTFDQRLTRSDDPAELRELVRIQRGKTRDAQHVALLLTTSFRQMMDASLLRDGLLLVVALGLVATGFRASDNRQQKGNISP